MAGKLIVDFIFKDQRLSLYPKLDEVTIKQQNQVSNWLLVGVVMIFIQIVIGGVTRLTGSGLSITEWAPILGTIPPLNEADWLVAFKRYQEIAQFEVLNSDMGMSDFKFIFFWEWFHRLWARSLGVVFFLPFVYFVSKKYFKPKEIFYLLLLFVLGGLQGFLGWFMVKSGLNDTDLHVSHIRLAIHFMAAIGLLIYAFWLYLKYRVSATHFKVFPKSVVSLQLGIIVLVCIQFVYGAFMAGLKAANMAPTWPKINGEWVPALMKGESLTGHPLSVHFIHRNLAYILLILVVFSMIKIRKWARIQNAVLLYHSTFYSFILIIVQVLLGIFSVLTSLSIVRGHFGLFESLAELHQIVGMTLFLVLFFQYYLMKGKKIS